MIPENLKGVLEILDLIDTSFEGKSFDVNDLIVAWGMMLIGACIRTELNKQDTLDIISAIYEKWESLYVNRQI